MKAEYTLFEEHLPDQLKSKNKVEDKFIYPGSKKEFLIGILEKTLNTNSFIDYFGRTITTIETLENIVKEKIAQDTNLSEESEYLKIINFNGLLMGSIYYDGSKLTIDETGKVLGYFYKLYRIQKLSN